MKRLTPLKWGPLKSHTSVCSAAGERANNEEVILIKGERLTAHLAAGKNIISPFIRILRLTFVALRVRKLLNDQTLI